MAVYTEVSRSEALGLLRRLDIGALTRLRGIQGGIENTNYFLSTDRGEYVLTLFERLTHAQLPFYLHLMKHLAQRGLPAPEPVADARGEILHTLLGKPASVVTRLRGASVLAPAPVHCAAVGAVLARMHLAAQDFGLQQPNLRGLAWWNETAPVVLPHLDAAQAELLTSELALQNDLAGRADYSNLPRGPVHADLFRDNVLFDHIRVSGLIDFYYACRDYLLFDLAVICNDWAVDDDERYQPTHWRAFMTAYSRRRPPDETEITAWPAMLRAAALRFWVSRLIDMHFPMSGEVVHVKDPAPFKRLLLAHRVDAPALMPA